MASAPREFHPHAVLARPYLLLATPHRLKRLHARAVAIRESHYPVCALSPAVMPANFRWHTASRPRVSRSLRVEVMAHRPYGSSQTDRIRLPYAGRELSARRSFQ